MERNLTSILECKFLMTFKSYLGKNLQNPNGETDGFKKFLTEDQVEQELIMGPNKLRKIIIILYIYIYPYH